MSLIHDALRKAAEENRDRHGQRGRPNSWRDVEPPPPPRRSRWPWVAAAALLALGLSLLAWSALRPASPVRLPEPPVVIASAAAATPAPVAAAVAPVAAPAAAPPPVAPAPVPSAPVEKRSAPAEAAPPAPAPAEKSAPRPVPQPAAPQPAAPQPAAPVASAPNPAPAAAPSPTGPKMIVPPVQTGQVANDTYVLEAAVDGKNLRLDFIVWSETPFAQINGRQVGLGQQVDGFLVTAIARDSVTLETPTRRVLLKVR